MSNVFLSVDVNVHFILFYQAVQLVLMTRKLPVYLSI